MNGTMGYAGNTATKRGPSSGAAEGGGRPDRTKPSARRLLTGWGRVPCAMCDTRAVGRLAEVTDLLELSRRRQESVIARGLGRSYGDAALNDNGVVLCARGLNCFRSFDPHSGLLDCEAGVSFAEIIGEFLPRGWFLPTTPGTKYVTVGGAIAADVHGKNHHRVGSFGQCIEDFRLMLASGEVVRCSRGENAELFFATLGGMGLTGIIVSARFRLVPVEAAFVTVDYQKTVDLDHTLELFDTGDASYEHSVAWIDTLAQGASLGRGVVMQGNWAVAAEVTVRHRDAPLLLSKKKRYAVPFVPPVTPLNRLTVAAFNAGFYRSNGNGRRTIDLDAFFYPLDAIDHWNRLYGPRGFIQYQAFIPADTSRLALRELLTKIAASGEGSFLAVLKKCGNADGGLLSCLEPGHTLALDLPFSPRRTPGLCHDLDAILLRHRGRLYLAKDAMTDAGTFRRMYPRLPDFQRIKQAVDPHACFSSSQARRLGIVPP